jgi:adenine-specific DNA-methyltransferase
LTILRHNRYIAIIKNLYNLWRKNMATLNFKGKTFVQNHHLTVKYHQLVPKKTKSLTDKVNLNDNLIIHGDNLKVLKALLPTYAGKVKCIYIDPPYNTGNERWVYNDNVNSPMIQEWLGKIVDKEDLTRHDKWLCMMMPRLKLLRELLCEDGVIFVSIDENEQQHLRILMDEIYNETNHLATFVWTGRSGKGGTTKQVELNHEYVECYAKNAMNVKLKPVVTIKGKGKYKDTKGTYNREQLRQWGQGDRREDRPSMYFPIITPDSQEVYPKRPNGTDGRWRFGESTVKKLLEDGELDFVKDENGNVNVYRKIREGRQSIMAADSLLLDKGTASSGTLELKKIFGEKVFDNVKPTTLIRYLIELSTYGDKNSIILDSFAGSGTTAHAVLGLNKEDDGNRKFILVECEDYADKITAERVRRVIKGVKNAKNENLKKGLGGTFSYFELGAPIEMESILEGDKLPGFLELARYVFYTATGEEFNPKKVIKKKNFIGESKEYEVYLFYKPDIEYLKSTALTLERAKKLGPYKSKKRLIFAPSKYLDTDYLLKYRIDYCQLPFEIYKLKE